MSNIKQSKEVRAFKCPMCGKLLEITNESKEYVSINGNLTWGESIIFIGLPSCDYSQENPYRICVHCLATILVGGTPRNNPHDVLFSPPEQIGSAGCSFPTPVLDNENSQK